MNINTLNNFQNNNGQASCTERMKAFWATIPLFVKFVIVTTVLLYLVSWIIDLESILSNILMYTIDRIQIWRLFTSVFMTANLLNILFAFMSWVPDAIRLENTAGTVRYTLNFLVNSTMIQVLYCIFLLILRIFTSGVDKLPSAGLWPLIMAEITLLCLANPDNQVMMFMIPCPIRALYYPWALLGFFTVLNMNIRLDLLVGVGYGYLYFYYLKNKLQFTDNFITRCENNFVFRKLSLLNGFVVSNANNLSTGFTAYRPNPNANSNQTNSQPAEPGHNQPVTTPFKGKGFVVGKNYINFRLD